jgi:NACHT domain
MLFFNQLPRAKGVGYKSQDGIHRACLTETRITELQRIEEWEVDYTATAKDVYWLSGLSGSGKSTIAQKFAERSAKHGCLGASFFCSRDFQDRRNIHLIFPTLAYHLARRYPEFRVELIPIIRENPDVCTESLAVQIENLIIRPLQLANIRTTIVTDALDECEDNLGQPASAILSLLGRYINPWSSSLLPADTNYRFDLDFAFHCCNHTPKPLCCTMSIVFLWIMT